MGAIRGRSAYLGPVGLILMVFCVGLVMFPAHARTQPASPREFAIGRSTEGPDWRLRIISLRIVETPTGSGERGVTLRDPGDVLWGLKVVVTSTRTDWKPGDLLLSTHWFVLYTVGGKLTSHLPEGTTDAPGRPTFHYHTKDGRTEWELELLFAMPADSSQIAVGFRDLPQVQLVRDGVVAP